MWQMESDLLGAKLAHISPNYVVFYCICCEQGAPAGQVENCGSPALGCLTEPSGNGCNSQKDQVENSSGFWELHAMARFTPVTRAIPEMFVISGNTAFPQGSFEPTFWF